VQLGCVLVVGPSHTLTSPVGTSNAEESAGGYSSLTHFINPNQKDYSDQHLILESDHDGGLSGIPSFQAIENGPCHEVSFVLFILSL
jgi:hypothetical protein